MSNGTIWVPATGKLTIANYYNPVNLGGTVTTKQIIRQFVIPRINGKSIKKSNKNIY